MPKKPATSRLARNLARHLRVARTNKNMTQEQLAERAGTTSVYISMIESLRTNPSLALVEKLAQALGVDALSLLSER